jgi:peptidyl-prolyl cis-trans isomerase C
MSDFLKWVIIGLGVVLLAALVLQKEPDKKKSDTTKDTVIEKPAKPEDSKSNKPEDKDKKPHSEAIALSVNGENISESALEGAVAETLEQQRQLYAQFGQDFDKMLSGAEGAYLKLKLKGDAAEELIKKRIYAQTSHQFKIKISDTEIEERYQKEYQRVLDFYKERNNWTEKDIEEKLKEQKSSLAEFQKKIREIVFETLQIEALQAAVAGEVEISDVELIAFLEKDTEKYASQIVKSWNPTDAELKAYWAAHEADYGKARVKVRHILIRLAADAPEDALKAAQEKVSEIQKKFSEGVAFEELAKEFSEDPGSKNRGGDVGFVDTTTPFVKEFKEAALLLEAGQVSAPIRTRFGFHLIKADSRTDLTLDQLRPQLKEALKEEKSTELIADWIARAKVGETGHELVHVRLIWLEEKEEANKLAELLKSNEEFSKLVQAYSKDGSTIEEEGDLGWFAPDRFGDSFRDEVAKLDAGMTSSVFAMDGGLAVIKLEARESEKTFEQIRDTVKADFLAGEREERFKKWYDETRAKAVVVSQDPLLTAQFLEQAKKTDEALAAYEALLTNKNSTDRYLSYYVARLYQSKSNQAQKQKKELEKQTDKASEIQTLDKNIKEWNALALKYLTDTLKQSGGDKSLYEAILKLDDTNAIVHYQYGLWLFGEGKLNDAIVRVKKAIEIDSSYSDAIVLYGDLLRTNKDYIQAAEYYEKALVQLPESRELQRKLAESYAGASNWEKAKEAYAKLLEKNPKDALLLVAFGDVSYQSGDFENAEKYWSQAITIDGQIATKLKLATLFLMANKPDQALKLYEEILKASPDEAEAFLGLGQAYELKGDLAKALQYYLDGYGKPTAVTLQKEFAEKILAIDAEKHLEIRLALAEMYIQAKLYEQAVVHYQALLSLPVSSEQRRTALLGMATARLGQSDFAGAQAAYKLALAATENKSEKVEIYEKLIETARAAAGEGQALPEEVLTSYFELAMLYKELNLIDEAKETILTLQAESATYRSEEVKKFLEELENTSRQEVSNLGSDGKPGQPIEILESPHIEAGSTHSQYNSVPPTSGPHTAIAAAWGVYDEPIPDETQVHNLEHGGVIVQYRAEITADQKKDLTELVTQLRKEVEACKIILAPNPKLDKNFALTAWGRLDKFDEFDAGRVVQFILSWIDQGPEKVPCS